MDGIQTPNLTISFDEKLLVPPTDDNHLLNDPHKDELDLPTPAVTPIISVNNEESSTTQVKVNTRPVLFNPFAKFKELKLFKESQVEELKPATDEHVESLWPIVQPEANVEQQIEVNSDLPPVIPTEDITESQIPVVSNNIMTEQDKVEPAAPLSVEDPAFITPKPIVNMVDTHVSYADAKIEEVEIAKVVPNPYQPRKVFDSEALQELADSIREHGVIQPIVVTRTETGYELVVGERRFRASQLAGLTKVPALVKNSLGDQTKLEVALIENIQRQELNPIEEAQAYERLIKVFHLTQEQVAKKVGKSRPAVANTIRLLNLPSEIQRGLIEGKVMEGHARAILGIPDMERQLQLYKMVIEQGMNVRQVEHKVKELSVRRQLDSVTVDPKFVALESQLRQKLSAQVKIQRSGRGGKITIEFFSEQELNEILDRMSKVRDNDAKDNYLTV